MKASSFWIGFIIGLLISLLGVSIAILMVPRLREVLVPPQSTVTTVINDVGQDTSTSVSNNTENTRPDVTTSSENIFVDEPEPYETVSSPVTVSGDARVFENVVSLRVLDGDGSVLAETFTTANSADIGLFGPFEIDVVFDPPSFNTGTIEIFEESARDGSDTFKVSIPVSFR